MSENVRVLSDLHVHGALVLPDDASGFPESPRLGTFVIKDRCLYGYLRIGGMETWYPFASKTQYHIHTQGLPATTWFVTHNLGTTNLWVQVKDENGNIVSVGKEDISESQFKLTFTTAVKGTVLVVAPDSVDVPLIKASLIEVGSGVQIDTYGVKINGAYALTSANIDQQIADAVAPKADIVDVDAALALKADITAVDAALALKADVVYVDGAIRAVVGAAPAALDTLKEIADQLASDESAASALTNTVALKADQTYVDAGLATKATPDDIANAVAPKADQADVDAALALKADSASLAPVASSGAYADLTGKPALGTAAAKDVAVSGDASSAQVVMGNDSRLADARDPLAHEHGVADLNIDGHIVPDTDVAYDLGSSQKRFRDLYLSGNTIYLGNASIGSAPDGTVALPAGSKIGDHDISAIKSSVDSLSVAASDSATNKADLTYVDAALALKANASALSSVALSGKYSDLTGRPAALSAFSNDSGFQTGAQVSASIQAVVGAAPAALDTLQEIAAQLASDESAVAALTTVVSGKADGSHVGATGSAHGVATTSVAGFMSAADKSKLDGVTAGATNTPLSSSVALAAGTASAGVSTSASRADHVHPLQTTVSGNAGTATKLATARTIAGVSFDGSANIDIPYSGLTGKPTLGTAASKDVAATGNASAAQVVLGNDSRLSDARTPVAHTHAIADVTNLQATIDSLNTALNAALGRISTLETNLANAVVYSDGKLHY